MKIVQSYWSKPSQKSSGLHPNDRNSGGWLGKKHHYMSWTLSCLQLNKFYDEVELVTDKPGYDLLVNQLKLPYTNIKIVLDKLNDYHSDLWALGKLYAYSIQEQSFIHVDGDVFIWDRFPKKIEDSFLCAQNFETDEPGYDYVYDFVQANFKFIPGFLDNKENRHIRSVNAGILGGSNISFFREYTSIAFDFVNKNLDKMEGLDLGAFNMFYEQYLFYCLARDKRVDIKCLVDDQRKLLDKHVNFTGVPLNTSYIHTVGFYKKKLETGELLEYTLKTTYPNHYYNIINLLKRHLI